MSRKRDRAYIKENIGTDELVVLRATKAGKEQISEVCLNDRQFPKLGREISNLALAGCEVTVALWQRSKAEDDPVAISLGDVPDVFGWL